MVRTTHEIPEEAEAETERFEITISGPNGSVTRRLWYPNVEVSVDDGEVIVESEVEDAKTTATVGTFARHVSNMLYGVTEGWTYEMEVFYSHFPMQVRVDGEEVLIENFLGERAPRRTTVHGDTEVSVDEESITLSGPDKDAVGQTAADIEQLTRVTDKDNRVFQDGVYITEKPAGGEAA